MINVNEIEEKLLSKRIVGLGRIDEKQASRAELSLLRLQLESSQEAFLMIDSTGGKMQPAMGLYDAIEHAFTMPITALVHGECYSAATFVLLACKKRLAMPHAQFMIHSGSLSNVSLQTDDLTSQKLKWLHDEIDQVTATVMNLYKKKLNKSDEDVKKYISRGDQQFNGTISAKEALDIGLITEIVDGKLPFFPAETS